MLQSKNIQEKALEFQARAFIASIPLLLNLHGLTCDIYLPQIYTGNYDDDGKTTYNINKDFTSKLIVFDYYQLGQYAKGIFDTYSAQNKNRIAITLPKDKLTKNSKVVVFQGSSYTQYRVDNFKEFTGSNIDPITNQYEIILIQNILIPLA